MKRLFFFALLLLSACSKHESQPKHIITFTFDDGSIQTMQVSDRISQVYHSLPNGPILEMWFFNFQGGIDNGPNGGVVTDGDLLLFAAPALTCNNQYFDSTNFYTQRFSLHLTNESYYANAITITENISKGSISEGTFILKASLSSAVTNSSGNSQRGAPLNKSVTITGPVGKINSF